MKTKSRSFHLSRQEQKLVDRLVAAFNSLDKHLRQMTQLDRATPFPQVVEKSLKSSIVTWEDSEMLQTLSKLRNVLVHEKVSQHHPVVPTPPFVEAVEQLRSRIRRPLLVIPTFRKSVETLPIIEPLATVLKIIDQRDYSQFPVYDGRVFKGLLTENGITRWLAHHVSREMSLVELNEVSVRMALREEENARSNARFVSKATTVGEVKALFSKYELLEAVLITSTGTTKEELLGIATRWDIVQLH